MCGLPRAWQNWDPVHAQHKSVLPSYVRLTFSVQDGPSDAATSRENATQLMPICHPALHHQYAEVGQINSRALLRLCEHIRNITVTCQQI